MNNLTEARRDYSGQPASVIPLSEAGDSGREFCTPLSPSRDSLQDNIDTVRYLSETCGASDKCIASMCKTTVQYVGAFRARHKIGKGGFDRAQFNRYFNLPEGETARSDFINSGKMTVYERLETTAYADPFASYFAIQRESGKGRYKKGNK